MEHNLIIEREAITLDSLTASLPNLFSDAITQERLTKIIKNDLFSPAEDEEIGYWFARFITIRRNLWSIVETSINNTGGMDSLYIERDYQYFVLGYAAVCSLVKMDRFLINKVAYHTLVQRKLNEELPEHHIARKQFIKIHTDLVQPSNAIRIHQAHRILKKRAKRISVAVHNTPVESIFNRLPQLESAIDLRLRHYALAWIRSRKLSWRRLGASAKQKSIFTVLEYSGRIVSEINLPRPKRVTPNIRRDVEALVQPGDIFITRHRRAMTNLFLPGYWPHAALYIGYNDNKKPEKKHWSGKNCTFEALKDGVHFRPLDETLNVDAFVIIRPNFTEDLKEKAINRVISHAGKGYNFDFDFFRSDQLVCTEVVYRAYDGIDDKPIKLTERMGRKTLSAEDLLDLSLDTDWADVIAIFGVRKSKKSLVLGAEAITLVRKSYRNNP